jgi:CRISPR-associated protein Cmr2
LSAETAVLTFSIGPVHTFIAQARRVADLWAGSVLLSHLIRSAIKEVHTRHGSMLFPYVAPGEVPEGLPNRFVCRVPLKEADAIARAIGETVHTEWDRLVEKTVHLLATSGVRPDPRIWLGIPGVRRQTDGVLDIAWSWVPEAGGYKSSNDRGARQFAASRMFRPFAQINEPGKKCPLCGERTALPNGNAADVRDAWAAAADETAGKPLSAYFRTDQSHLCLVCATKRLFPHVMNRDAHFDSFQSFQPEDEHSYFAVVSMDGDNMGKLLGGDASHDDTSLEHFHRDVSQTLTRFANTLRTSRSTNLNLANLDCASVGTRPPQLIYAGGEDVLFIADPRDAIPVARAIRNLYRSMFSSAQGFTISAGVLFAHTKHPAGLLFNDVDTLLNDTAKKKAGRDAIAIRLDKRSGVTADVAWKWDETATPDKRSWIDLFTNQGDGIVSLINLAQISSVKTYQLAEDARSLSEVFEGERHPDGLPVEDLQARRWSAWIGERLSKSSAAPTQELVEALLPFMMHRKVEAVRIARFLARETGGAR